MKYKSSVICPTSWEIEMDLIQNMKDQLKERLTKAGIKTVSDNPLYDFFNFKKRYIAPKPRIIKKSKEFICPTGYELALDEIEEKILNGSNLSPYLSKEIKDAGYNDDILNDWNIHHLHLSRRMGKDGFVQRSNYQLFIFITDDICHLIQIYPHNKPHLYSTQEMIKIIDKNWPDLLKRNLIKGDLTVSVNDAEYDELRKAHITTFVQTEPNRIFGVIGGGYMSNGYSQSALSASDFWHNICRKIEKDIINQSISWIIDAIYQVRDKCNCNLKIKLLFFKTENDVVLFETTNNVIIEINYTEGYIRVCDPMEFFR
ncbi:MAG: hypothetical protein E7396_02620 [Ruminococcaceae bacterium]|nr:hypothetical protein [Oscillospiraceae bacterium]